MRCGAGPQRFAASRNFAGVWQSLPQLGFTWITDWFQVRTCLLVSCFFQSDVAGVLSPIIDDADISEITPRNGSIQVSTPQKLPNNSRNRQAIFRERRRVRWRFQRIKIIQFKSQHMLGKDIAKYPDVLKIHLCCGRFAQ